MKYSLIEPEQLTEEDLDKWREIQQTTPHLRSPYFCPEFTLAAAKARRNVQITVLKEGGRTVGFFPFERGRMATGGPVGGILSDYQGVIATSSAVWNAEALLHASALTSWRFDHLIAEQGQFGQYHSRWSTSPVLDLSQGFTAYLDSLKAAGAKRLGELERKPRKLSRDVGPLRFVTHSRDRELLEQVFQWKSDQCRRTGAVDYFSQVWTRTLVEEIWNTQSSHFSGRLSALYAGDQLVAAHMGMRSTSVWHWWFPVYNQQYAKYSPGALLLRKAAESATAEGLQQLDLGKGDESFKRNFANCANALAEGRAWRPTMANSILNLARSTETFVNESSLAMPVRPVLKAAKQWISPQSTN